MASSGALRAVQRVAATTCYERRLLELPATTEMPVPGKRPSFRHCPGQGRQRQFMLMRDAVLPRLGWNDHISSCNAGGNWIGLLLRLLLSF